MHDMRDVQMAARRFLVAMRTISPQMLVRLTQLDYDRDIAFVALEGSNNFNIYTMTPEGKDVIKLTTDAGSNESPSWSPDGRHLVFMSTRTGASSITP